MPDNPLFLYTMENLNKYFMQDGVAFDVLAVKFGLSDGEAFQRFIAAVIFEKCMSFWNGFEKKIVEKSGIENERELIHAFLLYLFAAKKEGVSSFSNSLLNEVQYCKGIRNLVGWKASNFGVYVKVIPRPGRLQKRLKKGLASLSGRSRLIIDSLYYHESSLAAVAERDAWSVEDVRIIYDENIENLKQALFRKEDM